VSITQLLDEIAAWARANPNITALVLTGSLARPGHHPDEFSDLDLELIAKDPGLLSGDGAWLHQFAPIWTMLALDEGQPYPTRLVIYEGGLKVDFTIASLARVLDMIERSRLDTVYERGYRVLFDKEGVTTGLPEPAGAVLSVGLPDQATFHAVVEEFWFEAAHIPKYLVRYELWVVKTRDWTMKRLLLKLIEWRAIAGSDDAPDVWYIGTHMRAWTDARTWDELQRAFGRFDVAGSWWALLATIELFGRLGREIAVMSELEYPEEMDEQVSRYILGFADRLG
jgi:aminoglycoside 6-adenylyltransferase